MRRAVRVSLVMALDHMNEVAAAHVVALLFGAGAAGMSTPETDGGNFVAKMTAYRSAGGTPLCP